MKKLLLASLSRIIQGIGMGVCGLSLVCMGWFVFFSFSEYRYYLAALTVLGLVSGYYIFKFAVRKIYDESPSDW
ncbi:hypothetical protein [Erwinia sp. ErVv1]|uniref:hypothetical protein n=1 Tax=Erwinia sp. ErVv1 TaxID=1603299 RepID=UPI0008345733|nr:hypothetical protein [Erwinia sp. ErVv1]